jgi:hypothetical protein
VVASAVLVAACHSTAGDAKGSVASTLAVASPAATSATTSATTVPAATTSTGAATSTTTTTVASEPSPAYTDAQLQAALLRAPDVPAAFRSGPPPSPVAICGLPAASSAVPTASRAGVSFTSGSRGSVGELLGDYGGHAGEMVAAVRRATACQSFQGASDRRPTTVTPISPADIASGIDVRNGAEGLGVELDMDGSHVVDLWIRQGDLVLEILDRRPGASAVATIALGQQALVRLKDALA